MDLPTNNSRLLKYAQSRGFASHPSEVEVTSIFVEYDQFCQPDFDCNGFPKKYQGFFSGQTTKVESQKLGLDQESAYALCATQRHMRAQPQINWTKTLPSLDLSFTPQSGGPMDTEHDEDNLRTTFSKTGLGVDSTELLTTKLPLFLRQDLLPPEGVQESKTTYDDNFEPKKLIAGFSSLALMSKARHSVSLLDTAVRCGADPFETEPQSNAIPLETVKGQEAKASQSELVCPSDLPLVPEFTTSHDTSNPIHAPIPFLPFETAVSSDLLTRARDTTQVGSVKTSGEPVNTPDSSPDTLDNKKSNTVSNHFFPDSTKDNISSAHVALEVNEMTLDCEMPSLKDTAIGNQPRQSSVSGSHESSINPASLTMGLGSLSKFMETRGLNTSTESSSNPPFSSDVFMDSGQKQSDSTPSETTNQVSDTGTSYQLMRLDTPSTSITYGADVPLAIFLSADLLRTNLPLVQSLEQQDDPPKLLYREYTPWPKPIKTNIPVPRKSNWDFSEIPPEADLIIAPSVGIILATAQDLTQLYLPGHGPRDPEIRNTPNVTSPLRERIARLASRYKTLHVLVSHPTSNFMTNPNEPALSDRQLRLDKFTHDAIASMNDFCRFFKTDIALVHTPAIPEKIAELTIVLATIASSGLLPIHIPPTSSSLDEVFESVSVPSLLREDETRWELCLRNVGLNPYAARVVLDILEAGGRVSVSCSLSRGAVDPESACSMFLKMGYHERMSRFQLLLGEHLLLYLEENLLDIYDEQEDDLDFNSTYRSYSL
ncbi:uncharacterized protein N7483_011842 [Penicillium malachiteum]|uniref:uncharacterized protein n=1 Tax=Penicillium malachiteum TaxID=1324776 RepID=UPI0025498EA7|nr:uncharacterized protein N7483_011842 [Penicillium malachiteum]KAJ5714661.1 hypothetical protein N7483_011842 [Penicillium malachiteum]